MSVLGKDKFILDATSGFRMMWFNKHHPNTVYLDQRPECEPDIVGDFRDLRQFPDETFRLIVFDPPHYPLSKSINNTNIVRTYGMLCAETWQDDIRKGFAELWRILKPYGILLFKWNNQAISSDRLIELAPEKPLFYQITAFVQAALASGKRTRRLRTLWFCFMKIPVVVCVGEQGDEP